MVGKHTRLGLHRDNLTGSQDKQKGSKQAKRQRTMHAQVHASPSASSPLLLAKLLKRVTTGSTGDKGQAPWKSQK
eukprot:1158722-Pelagomonas_calceolata.AAC.3